MTNLYENWSTTAASNTLVGGISIAEGCAAANLNNGMRAIMADVAKWRDATGGAKSTTGSLNAYVLTTGMSLGALASGQRVTAKLNFSATGASTLAVDGLTATAIKKVDGTAITSGDLPSGGVFDFVYDGTFWQVLNIPQGTGFVTSTATFTDNYLIRADGAVRGVQTSAWILSDAGVLSPTASDGGALGSTALMVSDLFLASGAVINWNNGDVTETHAANNLTWAGATSYVFDAALSIGTSAALTAGTIELGAASDTTLARVSAGVMSVEGSTVAMLGTEDQVLAGGARVTIKDLGTVSSGTTTPDPGDRPIQKYINGGAHTLAPGSNNGSYFLDITNNGSAGAITISGWTKTSGTFTTTNGHKFRCMCSIGDAGSLLMIQALQ